VNMVHASYGMVKVPKDIANDSHCMVQSLWA
jgi:hypothetical protein